MASISEERQFALLGKPLKQGERILAPTRRPDGTLRKAIRIRAGYVPQEEVAIYQPKGVLLRKGMINEFPPGYDPPSEAKPKSKAAKRNERKKEKKQHAKDLTANGDMCQGPKTVEEVQSQMMMLSVSENPEMAPSSSFNESRRDSAPDPSRDLDKKIRALKKKIRLAEPLEKIEHGNLKPEQVEKLSKLVGWRQELQEMEDKMTASAS